MRYIGISLLLIAAVFIDMAFNKHLKLSYLECEGFLLLFKHARSAVSLSASPFCEWILSFRNDRLSSLGFLDNAVEKNDPYLAFIKCRGGLCMDPQLCKKIESLLFGVGKGTLEDELRIFDTGVMELEESLEKSGIESKKWGKIVRTSLYAISVSVAIILV